MLLLWITWWAILWKFWLRMARMARVAKVARVARVVFWPGWCWCSYIVLGKLQEIKLALNINKY